MPSPAPLPCSHAGPGSGSAVGSALPVPPPQARWMSPVTLALKLLGFGVYGASAGNEADEPLGVVNVMAGGPHRTTRFGPRSPPRLSPPPGDTPSARPIPPGRGDVRGTPPG